MKKKVSRALIFHYIYYLHLSVLSIISTIYCRFIFKLKGVVIKSGSIFFGIPVIYLFPDSKISIGKNIIIRTSRISNFIGINRRTMISTHDENAEIFIGDNCAVSGVVIGAKKSIIIGNHVMIGANVLITDFDWHSISPKGRNQGESSKSKQVVISDNVFIGYCTTILKGVTIGKNSVIGANSVVTSKIPANVIAAGNPCKVIKNLYE